MEYLLLIRQTRAELHQSVNQKRSLGYSIYQGYIADHLLNPLIIIVPETHKETFGDQIFENGRPKFLAKQSPINRQSKDYHS